MATLTNPTLADLPRPLAFVFSGGAAHGAIQAGQLQAAFEAGLSPDFSISTSVGSFNAAWLGQGLNQQTLDSMRGIWTSLNNDLVWGRSPLLSSLWGILTKKSMVTNRYLHRILATHLGGTDQSELPLKTHIMVTDLLTAKPVRLDRGPVVRNMLASGAIPGVFPSVQIDGRDYVDGGVATAVPVAQAVELGAKTLVVFDTGFPCALPEAPKGPIQNLVYLLRAMSQNQSSGELALLDDDYVVLYVPASCRTIVAAFDFSKPQLLIDEGEREARRFFSTVDVQGPGIYGHPGFAPPVPQQYAQDNIGS